MENLLIIKSVLDLYNLFGGQGNSKRRCRYMHFNKSSLVPHPQLKLVNKFGNLNSIKVLDLDSLDSLLPVTMN